MSGLPQSTTRVTVLDNACGNGIVTQIVFDAFGEDQRARLQVTAGDFSPSMVNVAKERIVKNNWTSQAKADIIDMQVCDKCSRTLRCRLFPGSFLTTGYANVAAGYFHSRADKFRHWIPARLRQGLTR